MIMAIVYYGTSAYHHHHSSHEYLNSAHRTKQPGCSWHTLPYLASQSYTRSDRVSKLRENISPIYIRLLSLTFLTVTENVLTLTNYLGTVPYLASKTRCYIYYMGKVLQLSSLAHLIDDYLTRHTKQPVCS